MTDGMAAASPAAVATSASAMPGATVASVAFPVIAMPEKAFMIPHTVPNRPMNGVALPVVARNGRRFSIPPTCSWVVLYIARYTFSTGKGAVRPPCDASPRAASPRSRWIRVSSRYPARNTSVRGDFSPFSA